MTKNCDSQWKMLNNRVKDLDADDDQIEIIVEDDAPVVSIEKKKEDALAFWMKRIRSKKTVIDVQENKQIAPAMQSNKIPVVGVKAALPIGPHKPKADNKESVINVQEESTKANVQKYKKSLFGETASIKKPQPKPAYVQSEESKKRRFQKQLAIIEEMNQPRWMQQKTKRQEKNMTKYSIPSSGSEYNYVRGRNNESFDNLEWFEYERKEAIRLQKKKEKELEAKKIEKEKRKEEELERKKKNQEELQNFLNGMIGIQPTKKQKMDESFVVEPEDNAMIKVNEADEQQEEDHENAPAQGDCQELIAKQMAATAQENQANFDMFPKKIRTGLKDHVRPPYESRAPGFINDILKYDYAVEPLLMTKKTPNMFEDISAYRKVFHQLIANECKADIGQRLVKLEQSNQDALKISINNYKTNNEELTELFIRQVGKEGEQPPVALKNMCLSKYRLGLITSSCEFKKQEYGFNDKTGHFSVLILLVTPQTKEELSQDIKVYGNFKLNKLEYAIKKLKIKEFFFHDMEKLTTHVRQYLAVSNLAYCQLAPLILDPKILETQMKSFVKYKDCLNDILENLKKIFNETQFQSIREMVLRERGIVLLQGPPGTGKTSTLMGLLSAQYEYLKKTKDNRKIMICAPSNAAVDHIVKRLQNEGIFNGQGEIVKPVLLRTGIVDSLDPDIRSVSLDQQCERKMHELQAQAKAQKNLTTPEIKSRLILLQKEIDKLQKTNKKAQAVKKRMEYATLQNLMYVFRTKKVVTSKKRYHQLQSQFLHDAEIILTTLSSAGNEKLDCLRGQIACLIIDQAAQATETNLLIALQSGVQKVLLIGDPYQLPATCMSSDCNVTLFNRSLFQRFLDAKIKPYFLNIQYRMAPMIRHFPSKRFYNDRLVDSDSIKERVTPTFLGGFKDRNVIFIDVKYGKQERKGNSFANEAEGKVLGLIIKCLLDAQTTMGVITPYQAQRKVIMKQGFKELQSKAEEVQLFEQNIMVNTVDSFQGQQRDVILVSTVRANQRRSLGFLTDQRRINVTLTRAKFVLIVVGNGDTLGTHEVWNDFLEWTECKKVYYEIHHPDDLRATMSEVFQRHNEKPIRRKRYGNFTTDIRRVYRAEMIEEYKIKRTTSNHQTFDRPPNFPQSTLQKPDLNQSGSNKFARDIAQSNLIVQQKLRKQKETQEFQQMNNRMRLVQQQMQKDGKYEELFG